MHEPSTQSRGGKAGGKGGADPGFVTVSKGTGRPKRQYSQIEGQLYDHPKYYDWAFGFREYEPEVSHPPLSTLCDEPLYAAPSPPCTFCHPVLRSARTVYRSELVCWVVLGRCCVCRCT